MAEERTKPMASKRSDSRLGSSVPPTSRSRWRGVRPPATAGWESASSAIAVAPPGASEAGGGSSPRQEPMRCTCPAKPRAWTNNSSTVASPPPGTPTEGCLAPRTERSARRTNRTTRQPRKGARRRRRVWRRVQSGSGSGPSVGVARRAPPRRTRRAAGGGRMDQDAGLVILEDAPLEGMASVVERLGDEDDEAASLALEQHLDQQEVGRAGDRGIMRNLLDQFRGMTQVADLGTHPTKLEWLAFHVPPGGTGQLQLEVTGTQHAAVQLKVMGLGGGSGRKFTFGAERDLGTRDQCFALGAWIDVRLRKFRGRDDDAPEELRVDVEAVTNSYIELLRP